MSAQIKDRINELSGKFEALELRERWLVFLAAAVIFWLILDTLAVAPLGNALKKEQGKQAAAQAELDSTRQQLASLQSIFDNDPLSIKLREQKALEEQVTALETELSELAGGLVKADALPKILEELLSKAGDLRLQSMQTEPPELQLSDVYKHQVTVTLSGNFLDVLNYLKLLEQLPWRFYWEELNYSVQEYPNAEVSVRVYTLSTSEGAFNA